MFGFVSFDWFGGLLVGGLAWYLMVWFDVCWFTLVFGALVCCLGGGFSWCLFGLVGV